MENTAEKTVTVNGKVLPICGERNLLELIRKAGIDIPTFCYHSELSIYGACRLCLVEVEKRGIMASCSTAPEAGMVVHTDTKVLRKMRKINIELLLANHKRECPTCSRSASCTLQEVARKLGVSEVRYKQTAKNAPLDMSSPSLTRDPDKCVLCGDCVRVCSEVQSVGALDFAFRGSKARVVPAFNQDLSKVECVNCGQCAAVCPTGAIIPHQDRDNVWEQIYDPSKTVVVQIAPAVRVAIGERFGFEAGDNVARKLVTALRMMGFDYVYDTCYAADMTIFEEATEFLHKVTSGAKLPMFTSCCPGWVKFCETYYPEFLPQVSTTRSPQAIFGSVARKTLPEQLKVDPKDLVVVSIMPCTAKKFEAKLPKFAQNGRPDVDYVLTTSELAQMIESMGIDLRKLEPDTFDMPMGFSTGGAVIFGTTGGVMEAALRYAVEKLENRPLTKVDFKEVRGMAGRKTATLNVAGKDIAVAVVHGLRNARELIEDIKAGKVHYDFVEVMACPGGCVAGGGQPISHEENFRIRRAAGLYSTDKDRQVQKPQQNYYVEQCYKDYLGGTPGSEVAHHALHTHYQNRSQLFDTRVNVIPGAAGAIPVTVTICTKLENRPGEALLAKVVEYVKNNELESKVKVDAAYTLFPETDGTIGVAVGDMMVKRSADAEEMFQEVTCELGKMLK